MFLLRERSSIKIINKERRKGGMKVGATAPSSHAVSQSLYGWHTPRVAWGVRRSVSCSFTASAHGVQPPNAGRCPTMPRSRYRARISDGE